MNDFPLAFERPDLLVLLLVLLPIVGLGLWSRRKVSPLRRALAVGLRSVAVLTLVLGIAGLTWLQAVDALGVVFVVDRSASVGASGQAQATAFIEAALQHQGADDRVGVVAFGAEGMVELEPQADLVYRGVESAPSPHQTDIASGLRLATALLPSDRSRRIVVLSDGEQTRGDAAAQVLLAAGDDLSVSVVPLGGGDGPDVLLEDLLAPARVDEGASFDVRVVLNAGQPAAGSLRLYRNDAYLGAMDVQLEGAGRAKVLTFRQEAGKAGLHQYRATFEPADPSMDQRPQNNQVMSTVQVTGRPRVLVVDSNPGELGALVGVLRAEGLEVDLVDAAGMPSGVSGLRPYAAVFLSDVPAFALSTRQQKSLQTFVRDLGRGLVMLGGDNSFGVGGYYDTPVEAALPVGMDIEDKTRFPKLAMVHAIDKSCSMGSGAGSKLDLAKEAALQTVDLLGESDMLGVIGFDGAASFIVPLQELHDKQAVIDDVASIRAGGGTDIYPALERSIGALTASDAALKHIILLSDGMTSSGAFEPLIRDAYRNESITLTAIGIGTDSDRQTMQDFAQWGGGNYYLVTDPAAIPAIFTRETLLATREFLKEEEVDVRRASASELTAGLRDGQLPKLQGYVVSTPKKRATVALVAPNDDHTDPLLAHWRYGLGRSVAWTSDADGRWARDWIGTPAYTRLWGQVARWVVASGGEDGVQLETTIQEGELVVTVDAFDGTGGFRNFLDGETRIVAPDLTVHTLALEQVAPGRYAARMPVDQDGSWLVGVALKDGEQTVGQAVEEAVQPYSPEYRSKGRGDGLLAELARVGGGEVLADPAAVFARPEVARKIPHPLWPFLLVLAAFLFLADIAVRRLAFGSAGTASLTRPSATVPRRTFRPTVPAKRSEAVDLEPDDEPPAAPVDEVDPTSYAGRLLAARRSAREKLGDEGDKR